MKIENKKVVYAWKFKEYLFNKEVIFYLKEYDKNKYRLMLKKEHKKDKRILPKRTKYIFIGSKKEYENVIKEITEKIVKEKAGKDKYEVIKNLKEW